MSFFELLVIAVVGLLVVGPERMPEAIRNGMLWFGRIKRTLNNTRQEFEQQLGVDEIRRELHNEHIMQSLKAMEDVKDSVQSTVKPVDEAIQKQIKALEIDRNKWVRRPAIHLANAIAGDDCFVCIQNMRLWIYPELMP